MTLIKGGTIVDGTGKPAFVGDVLVEGDRIVDVIAVESNRPIDQSTNRTIYFGIISRKGEA